MKSFIFFSLFLCLAIGIRAQEVNSAKLDSLFATVENHQKLMGSLALYREGEEIYSNSAGYLDAEKATEADADTKYRIGSITKTFTSVLLFQLMEEGKLTLQTKLSQFYPEMPNASKISIEHMLAHQSGLYNFTDHSSYLQSLEKPKTKEELLELFKEYGAVFEPGEKTAYSNTNYVLLTFIAEDISGKSYPQLLQEKITKPLGIQNTYYGGKINTSNAEALSYKKRRNWQLNTETDMSIPQVPGE